MCFTSASDYLLILLDQTQIVLVRRGESAYILERKNLSKTTIGSQNWSMLPLQRQDRHKLNSYKRIPEMQFCFLFLSPSIRTLQRS